MHVFIAVPTFETIGPETFKSIYDLDRGDREHSFHYVRGYTVAHARNKIAKMAMAADADYVLMVDSDVELPRDAVTNLVSHGEGVCLGHYVHRHFKSDYDGTTNLCRRGETSFTDQYSSSELKSIRESGEHLLRIHGGGLGCALIRVDIFNQLDYPYFKWVDCKGGLAMSEDLYFCQRCIDAGIRIYADTRVACGHKVYHTEYC